MLRKRFGIGQESLLNRVWDVDFEDWQSTLPVGYRAGEARLLELDRKLLHEIQTWGLVYTFATSSYAHGNVLRNLDFEELAAVANVLRHLYSVGDVWEAIPESVRTCRVVCGSPNYFFERLTRFWSLAEMLDAGLVLGKYFRPDWDGVGEPPNQFPLNPGGRIFVGFNYGQLLKRRGLRFNEPGDSADSQIPGSAVFRDPLGGIAVETGVGRRRVKGA